MSKTYMYRGPSVKGKRCDPRTLPHWPIAMNMGMPVAFLVSEPRLCANHAIITPTEGGKMSNVIPKGARYVVKERKRALTVSVSSRSDTEHREVTDMDIFLDGKK
jgi:hypothetical protein